MNPMSPSGTDRPFSQSKAVPVPHRLCLEARRIWVGTLGICPLVLCYPSNGETVREC